MCLIIAILSNSVRPEKKVLQVAAELNDDGIGVAYARHNQLFIKKDFEDFDTFYEYFEAIPNDAAVLIHMRKNSAGATTIENRHPFQVNENLCMAFNGTIGRLVWKDQENNKDEKSDTFLLNELILKPIFRLNPEAHKKSWWFGELLGFYIGTTNKLVFLNNEGNFHFYNEKNGTWNADNTIWYSNMLWESKIKADEKKLEKTSRKLDTYKNNNNNKQTEFQYSGDSEKIPIITNSRGKQSSIHVGKRSLLYEPYYLRSDPYFRQLSLEDLAILSASHNGIGIKKLLKRKGLIAPLCQISEEKRLEARLKMFADQIKSNDQVAREIMEDVERGIQAEAAQEQRNLVKNFKPSTFLALPAPKTLAVSIGTVLENQQVDNNKK